MGEIKDELDTDWRDSRDMGLEEDLTGSKEIDPCKEVVEETGD